MRRSSYSSTHHHQDDDDIRREEEEEKGLYSCWGRLKLMIPWTKSNKRGRRRPNHGSIMHGGGGSMMISGCDCVSVLETRGQKAAAAGSFRYSPSSYAQNFDEWFEDNDEEHSILVDFSSRYAAPYSSSKRLLKESASNRK